MMKRSLVSLFACLLVLLNLVIADAAQAQPIAAISPGLQGVELTEQQQALLEQLKTNVLPQVENILSPEQRERFETAISDGTSFRKAFKSLSLAPEQKAELGKLFKSLPKKDIFASLTPAQKRQLFMSKKKIFIPTSEEIAERIKEKQGQE